MLRNSIGHRLIRFARQYTSNNNTERVILDSVSSSTSTPNKALFRQAPPQQEMVNEQTGSKLPKFSTQNELEKYSLMPNTSDITITGYIGPGFMINNVRVFGSIIVHPKQVFLWNVTSFEELTTESLKLLEFLSPTPGLSFSHQNIHHLIPIL